MLPENFSWLWDGRLAGCALPGGSGFLDADLRGLREQGVTAVITLTETPLPQTALQAAGLRSLHLPVRDFAAPSMFQMRDFVTFVREETGERAGKAVVHCYAGVGRTGTMLAVWLVSLGITPPEAVETVRRKRPGSLETRDQVQSVYRWAAWLAENRDSENGGAASTGSL